MRTPKELFEEIVKLASSVGKTEEVEEVVLSEQVDLEDSIKEVEAEVELEEDSKEEAPKEEAPKEEAPVQEMKGGYVSRDEYEAAIAELKVMYSKVLEVVSPSSPSDVPAELSSDVEVELEDEAAPVAEAPVAEAAPEVEAAPAPAEEPAQEPAQEAAPEPVNEVANEPKDDLVHTPDNGVESKPKFLYGQGRRMTTQDHVWASMFGQK